MEKNETKVRNVLDLRNDLIETYESVRNGEKGVREGKEIANIAGKILASAKLQLEYNSFTKSNSKIKFLEVNE